MTKKDHCLICQINEGKIPSKKIYEDSHCIAILDINGANPGHTFVIPKDHYPIFEQVPDEILKHLFTVANQVSVVIFEHLGVSGTNLFVSNGIPAGQTIAHFMINVIPRSENDGINLDWAPKQLSEEEMSAIELKLKEELNGPANAPVDQAVAKENTKHLDAHPAHFFHDVTEDQVTAQMRRIP